MIKVHKMVGIIEITSPTKLYNSWSSRKFWSNK